MAGGTWKTQNKRRPGAYINVKGTEQVANESNLGRLLLISNQELDWGKRDVVELTSGSNFKEELGTNLDDSRLVALKQALKGAETVLFLNTNDGTKAALTDAALPWTFTAKYPGTKGNDIHLSIEKDPVDTSKLTVTTLFGTDIVDQKTITTDKANTLVGNDYVDVQLTADDPKALLEALNAATSYTLKDGTTKQAAVEDLMNNVLENESYSVVTTGGFPIESNIHQLLVTAVKRLRDDEGMKIRAVVPVDNTSPKYNYEGVSQVINGLTMNDNTILSVTDSAAYFAGLSSSADAGTALTYQVIEDAIGAYPKLNNEKTIAALNAGQIVFTTRPGQRVVIEQDINSLTKFTADKPQSFSKNRVIRTLDQIADDAEQTFEKSFLGKVGNNATGRDLFQANRVAYLQGLQDSNIIQEFNSEDIKVSPGEDSDAIVVDLAVQPVDAMEKLYMTINVE